MVVILTVWRNFIRSRVIFIIKKSILFETVFLFSLQDKLPFGYDLEHIIDDWILMGFLMGNDFIPHLPNMHIRQVCET